MLNTKQWPRKQTQRKRKNTLAGEYGTLLGGPETFLVNWDSSLSGTNAFSDWASYTNVDHFEGISSVTNGIYTLSGDPSSLLTVGTNNRRDI